ncbi:MAG: hypothetical protein PHY80_04580 [Rickettsiales bacterium]|nr:hypothetical protein [Rickettsiales bacterium]
MNILNDLSEKFGNKKNIVRYILCIIFLSFSFGIFSVPAFSEEGFADKLDYKTQKEILDTKQQLILPKKIGGEAHHFYGYVGFDSGFETNTKHAESEGSKDFSDSYLTGKAYLIYALDLSPYSSWATATNIVGRFYKENHNFDDSFMKLETGPSFYFPSIKLAASVRPVYYFATENQKTYYSSKYPGGILKVNYLKFEKLNILGVYEYEERNYESKNTNVADVSIQKVLSSFRYRYSNNDIISFFPSYRNYNTEINYLDRDIFGLGFGYIHYLTIKLYLGGYYERIESDYRDIAPSDYQKRKDFENYYTALIGYEFDNNWIIEFSYLREKVYSNIDYIDTSYNNVFNLTFTYRFHFHKERNTGFKLRYR